MNTILVLNPGSTSTKVALYYGEGAVKEGPTESIPAPRGQPESSLEAAAARLTGVTEFLTRHRVTGLACIASRGGLTRPIAAGSYRINRGMLDDLRSNRFGSHASNFGAIMADELASIWNCPAIIADPVAVDEFCPEARFSGYPGIERRSRSHVLSIRAAIRRVAADLGKPFAETDAVALHLGGGISVAAVQGGRIVDVNDSNEGGPFTPQRAGSLPILQLVELCYSGRFESSEGVVRELTQNAGLRGYLGTDDGREIIERIGAGDGEARNVLMAMAYQIAKEAGASAAALSGNVDAVVITGGFARPPLVDWIRSRTDWIAPARVYPGELEMLALAEAADRLLRGVEEAEIY